MPFIPPQHLRAALLDEAERRLGNGELSRAVGVSHGAPRRHFADKQALLDALAEEGFQRLGHTLSHAAADGDFTARLAERVAKAAFAAVHGFAALANAGVLEADDGLVTETVERLVLGLKPR